MNKKFMIGSVVLLVLLTSCGKKKAGGNPADQIKAYAVEAVSSQDVELTSTYPAVLKGQEDIDIKPRVDGFIEKVFVDEGAIVHKGQPLFKINSPASVQNVQNARAVYNTAKLDVDRIRPLADKGIYSKVKLTTYENALALKREIAVGSSNARVSEIKQEIKGLGDINLGSIEEYKTVFERHSELATQCDDLHNAKRDLETLIVELTQTMETVFLKQFELIQQNFSSTFAELFGGGQAELRLADKNDVLGCDIDIIAQPPGKKLQLLSLLSGGERTLTAIALLFAMLKLKPPAFCMLDEIESALDEANVSRFADYVKRYSDGTQFILITHRKGSMEVCDTLYGVSMEEKGVSKVVSARFGEDGITTAPEQAS